MTKKHFIAFAEAIRRFQNRERALLDTPEGSQVFVEMVRMMMSEFRDFNGRFNYETFMKAAEVGWINE